MSDDSGTKWLTLFDNMNAKAEAKKKGKPDAPIDLNDIPDIDEVMGNGDGGSQGNKKRLSVERIYQKKSQLEHILLRPDTYIGSLEKATQPMWVYDDMRGRMIQREITFVPGLYKIFDEILVNAADNKQRDPTMNCIKIDIDPENNKIKIWNNGKGIPVVEHKTEKMFVPTLIFGHLLTSSNYDDTERKVTGGRNGYGAKLCNIFSKKFTVETSSNEYKKAFKQSWENNMGKSHDPKIVTAKGDDYTCVTFYPDLAKFKMDILDKDIVDLFSRRAYDVAGSSKGVKVFLNGKRLAIKGFKDYVDLYIKENVDDNGQPLKIVYESTGPRWEVAVTLSDKGFQQVSFVNSIATTKGGKHTDVVADQIVTKLIDVVKKKQKKGDNINIKPFQVRTHIWVFVNCLIENPTFDSQTKENMTLQAKSFGSKCSLSDKFFQQASKCGIIESIMSWMKFKAQEKMNQKCSKSKHSKLKGIPKLDDANDAGTKNSGQCTLILTEGDSAKSLAVAGLGVVGRDKYGVFPLKGKLLNVREASAKQIMENAEINNLIKILGLRYKETYENPDQLKTLRYGRLMIMTDQDQDGSHIKGLLINFIHHNWPNLLKHHFVEEFITPIVKIHKGQESRAFYSLPEFEEWKRETANWHTWKVKYYKGLGTSTAKEAKEYFSDMLRHRIPFKYGGTEDDASIVLAFSKKKIEERKEWLTNWMDDRKRRAQLGLPELYLYGKQTKHISYQEFVNRELILFSNMDNERSIPGLVDGLKPGQRKVLFTCLKRNLNKEIKVAQLAGSVSELSAYHHGEMSLMGTIIGLAQNFVGSNNINLLQPIGQFGTRLHGGKDAASPRYIFTALSPLTRLLFSINDDPLLKHLYDDNQKIEPEFYCPIIPMVLVNGAEGIGTGWSTKIPNYDPREIMKNLRRLMDGQEQQPMLPSFKNFKGTIETVDEQRYCVSGEISIIDNSTLEITELPIRTWTQMYKESVLEPMLQGTDKTPPMITDYKEYHTDTTVRFVIKMNPEKLQQCEMNGLHKVFKLQTSISIGSMVLFDSTSCIRKYTSVMDILQEFFTYRLDLYQRRKDYLEGMLAAESLKLDNQARFILEKIEGKIIIENKPKKELVQMLVRMGFDSDPVRSWKEAQDKLQAIEEGTVDSDDDEADSMASSTSGGPDFNYILSMALWCLTKEKKDELLKQRDQKSDDLYALRKKTPKDLWRDDMNKFEQELNKVEQKEREEEVAAVVAPTKTAKGRNTKKKIQMEETMPSPMGRRVEPRIDPALRAKSEAAANRKKKALKKKEEGELEMFAEDDEGSEIKSLAERIGNSPTKMDEAKGKKAPAKKRERKPAAEKKSPAKKGKKKKSPWEDSDESMASNLEESDMDDLDDSFKQLIPRSRGPGRAAATKAKYTFSDEEDEGGDDNFVGIKKRKKDNDDDFFSSLKSKGKSSRAFSDSEDDSQPTYTSSQATTQSTISSSLPNSSPLRERSPSPVPSADPSLEIEDYSPPSPVPEPPKKAPAAKKPAATKRKAKDGEPKPKKKAAPRKKQMMFDSSDEESKPKKRGKKKSKDSDDEFHMSPKKAPAKKKKAKDSDDDSDDFTMPPVTTAREGRGRKAAPVKYKFSDDEDDDSDF